MSETSDTRVREIVNQVFATKAEGLAEAVQQELDAKLADANLSDTASALATLTAQLEAVTTVLSSASTTKTTRARVALAVSKSGSPILDALSEYYVAGAEPPINPVLMASPPSLGKSFAVRQLGATYDRYLEHGCSDDIDEIASLIGGPVPDGHGGFIVVDGLLTEAVRAASHGQTVMLLFDEVLRLSPRAQETMLTFLTGVKQPDGSRKFRLRTRKALPSGTLEVIECPTTHLHLVGATNLGLTSPVEAFWSRWTKVRVEFTKEIAKSVSSAILAAHCVNDPSGRLAGLWSEIADQSRQAVAKGRLRFPVDMRVLEGAAQMTTDGKATTCARRAAKRLADASANWNVDTGDVDADSVSIATPWITSLKSI